MSTVDASMGGREFQEPEQEQSREPKAPTRRWRPGRRARWGGAVAATVLVAGGAAAVAAHHGFEERDDRASAHADGRGHGHTRADRADGHDGGPDGVRHAVTVDGATLAITSNTVTGD
ncbi:hypothetical protein OG401_02785 [Kitasatospora purpeofusca]|uniref:hypothetical protein n=1 Tax=Kitasatospora purpeofusca TaxID=67352 RepID=UPI002254B11E|nr:hypothetical protein [Kitasatospora purpeofusca]MCX4683247.1 hypothetical protein [Kitasatospora purpeofusca]